MFDRRVVRGPTCAPPPRVASAPPAPRRCAMQRGPPRPARSCRSRAAHSARRPQSERSSSTSPMNDIVRRHPFPSTRVRQQLWACMPDHACQQRALHMRGPLHTQGVAACARRLSLSVRCRPARRTPREPPPRTPEPVPGRQHADLQTDTFLEELTDVVAEEVAGTSRTLVHDPDVTCQAALGEHSGVSCRSWLSRITACRHADRCLPAAAADAALRAAQARRGRGDADR
jgi:hypothetical protein